MPLASLTLEPPWDVAFAAASLLLIVAIARFGDRWLASLRSAWRPAAHHTARQPLAPVRPGAAKRHGGEGRRSRVPRIAALAMAGALIALTVVVAHRPDGLVRVTVLDVGQGDGILVESGRGGRMVVDGGPDPTRLLIALDERLPPWDRRIDILVLTHPHEDHVAGLALLLQRYRVGRVYEPGMLGPGPGYRAWADIFDGRRTPTRPPLHRRPAEPRPDPIPGPVAGREPRPRAPSRRRHLDQQRLDRAPRRGSRGTASCSPAMSRKAWTRSSWRAAFPRSIC